MHDRVCIGAICFPGESLDAVAGHWRELAPPRVSLISYTIDEAGLPAVREAIQGGGYRLENFTHPLLGMRPLSDRSLWPQAREKLAQMIGAVEALGGRSIYMLTGGHGRLAWEEAAEAFCELVAPGVAQARDAGVQLMIESASPVFADVHITHSLRDTVHLAEMAGIGVCIDVFTCWTEAGLKATIEKAIPNCHLIQLSDHKLGDRSPPNRCVPGDGDIPLKQILGWALDAGYAGAFDFELLGPRIDQEGRVAACKRTADWLGDFLAERGA
jgi:sugar phosphate isomerase/epimerase